MKNTTLIFMILFLLACNGSKSLTKKGTQLEFAGNFDQAADNYYNALLKNRQNIEAQIGLSSAGQKVFDRNIQEFNSAFQISHFKDAVYEYENILAFNRKLNNVGMKFEPSEKNKIDYSKAKENYLSELYTFCLLYTSRCV